MTFEKKKCKRNVTKNTKEAQSMSPLTEVRSVRSSTPRTKGEFEPEASQDYSVRTCLKIKSLF